MLEAKTSDSRACFRDKVWGQMAALYTQKGLAPFCLEIQEHFDVDVPVFLFLHLADEAELGCNDEGMQALIVEANRWRDLAVRPIRAVRVRMKQEMKDEPEADFRQHLKSLELRAEHVEVDKLGQIFAQLDNGPGELVRRYLAHITINQEDQETILRRMAQFGG